MKTVKCSRLLVCILFLLGFIYSSTCLASDTRSGHVTALDNTIKTKDLDDGAIVEDNDDFDFDYEQYAYDDSGDDDTYVDDDQGEDSDLEPAPEFDDPASGPSGDDSAAPAPEPESSDEE